jgi:aminoglycoside phosphotransferase (APT) family kinase protein
VSASAAIAPVPGPLLASGASADVHAWGERRVVKLYTAGVPEAAARREAELANAARRAGAPAPAAFEVVSVGGRHGVVFERIDGPTLLSVLLNRPDQAAHAASTLAALHADLHARHGGGLPPLHERVAHRIAACSLLPPDVRDRVAAIAAALPPGHALCHGDFHPGNVIVGSSGPSVIDWYDAACGPAEADLARTLLLIEHADLPGGSSPAVERLRAALRDAYLRDYHAARTIDAARLGAWIVVAAAARLVESRSAGERTRLLEVVTRGLGHP